MVQLKHKKDYQHVVVDCLGYENHYEEKAAEEKAPGDGSQNLRSRTLAMTPEDHTFQECKAKTLGTCSCGMVNGDNISCDNSFRCLPNSPIENTSTDLSWADPDNKWSHEPYPNGDWQGQCQRISRSLTEIEQQFS